MQQFSEEHLAKLEDRLEFLDFTRRNAHGFAKAIQSPQGRNQATGEAIQYSSTIEPEMNALTIQIRALKAYLQGVDD